MEEIQLALELKAQLDALRPIDKEQEGRIMQKFRLDWNYHSNHLEGNKLTYGETKALILHGITAQGKPLKDTLEITGHNEAINWVLEMIQGERPLTENFIRELHTLLLKEPYEVDALTPDGKPTKKKINVGSYKSSPNHVLTKTGEIFYFSTPEETPAKMNDLLSWFSEKSKEEKVNPIFLAAEFHYKFIRIHPFDDGNGRTARILMNFILMQFGFPPTIIKSDADSKNDYFAALQLADAGNIEAFITFITQNLNRSLQIMIAGAKGEEIEEDDDLDKEIALLEQRLKSAVKDQKNDTHNNEIFVNQSLIPFFGELLKKLDKFSKFYLVKRIYFQVLDEKYELFPADLINDLKAILISHLGVHQVKLEIYFYGLNHPELQSNNYSSLFQVRQNGGNNEVLNFRNEVLLVKPYGTQLTESEIDKIVKSEVKRHKEFIEQKIAEKENK